MEATGSAIDVVLIGARVLVAVILLRAAVGKARAPGRAVATIADVVGSQPAGRSASILWLLVAWELVAGLAMLAGLQVALVSVLIAATMLGFAAVLLARRARGVTVGCGCFGGDSAEESVGASVVRNVIIAGCALALSLQTVVGATANAALPVWSLTVGDLIAASLLAVTAWLFWLVAGAVGALQAVPRAHHDW